MSDDKNFGKGEGEDAINPLNPGKGDLSSEASDAIDDAKENSDSLGDKAKEKFEDAKEAAEEFSEKAKEKGKEFTEDTKKAANDFANDAKKTANEFADDVKQTFDPNNPDSGKTVAIISHITAIGWIVALIMNSQNKTEFGSFYIRQTLGIWLLTIVLSLIPIVGCFAAIIGLILIIISLVNAANNKMVPIAGLGEYFQDWFKGL
ncbi:hypothetical protein [Cytophaga sp. FL35]|uniref:YtxH domain-containing protein n=1 Tax=Cytophaga sp. FL35 TaxID=1904456 RepID=UPI001CA3AFBB|nr:hypothetical protein [Cytophaga sp. FL35]